MVDSFRREGFRRAALRALASALALAVLLAGCFGQPRLEVEVGEYTQVRGTDDATRAAAAIVRSLNVDREMSTAVLTLKDDSRITLTFAARDRSKWPQGCPTNITSYHMEVLDIEEPELAIDSLTVRNPVLVRDCPGDPVEIVLREDGQIGGGGGARNDASLVFSRP